MQWIDQNQQRNYYTIGNSNGRIPKADGAIMPAYCHKCWKDIENGENAYATTQGIIKNREFEMDIEYPWEEILCMNCYDEQNKKKEPVIIKITIEGGIIQAISQIPEDAVVEIYDFDIDGIDIRDLTRIKVRPNDPSDNECCLAVVTKWLGPSIV